MECCILSIFGACHFVGGALEGDKELQYGVACAVFNRSVPCSISTSKQIYILRNFMCFLCAVTICLVSPPNKRRFLHGAVSSVWVLFSLWGPIACVVVIPYVFHIYFIVCFFVYYLLMLIFIFLHMHPVCTYESVCSWVWLREAFYFRSLKLSANTPSV